MYFNASVMDSSEMEMEGRIADWEEIFRIFQLLALNFIHISI